MAAEAETKAAAARGRAIAAMAAAAVGLLPRTSMSSQSIWEFSPFFSQMTARVCGGGVGGPFPSYRTQDGPRRERAHLRPTNLEAQT